MNRTLTQILLILVVSILATTALGVAGETDAEYLWPLPASSELTSGFCQWRSGHYHSGIDIRTFGQTGYKAVAIADGFVERIATNWYGYGKVLYLRLNDGRMAVYAHLLKFTPEIDTYVQQMQISLRRYKTDLYPDSGQFTFKAGDVVAIHEKAKNQLRIKGAMDAAQNRGIADWLDVDAKKLEGVFKNVPERSDLSADINEHLVVELYSK